MPELVIDAKTGLIVKPDNEQAAAAAFQRLLDDKQFAMNLGMNAREHVKQSFDWNKNIEMMIEHYKEALIHS